MVCQADGGRVSAGTPRRSFRLSEVEWRATMARVQQARGTGGEVTPLLRVLLAIYRAVPLKLERQLRARALLEDRPVADLVVEALARYLEEPITPQDDDPPVR